VLGSQVQGLQVQADPQVVVLGRRDVEGEVLVEELDLGRQDQTNPKCSTSTEPVSLSFVGRDKRLWYQPQLRQLRT